MQNICNKGTQSIHFSVKINLTNGSAAAARPNIKLLGYSFKEQMKDILPNVGMAVLTAIVMISVNIINLSPVLSIITQIILGLFIYSFLSNLFKVEEFFYIKRLLSEFVSKIKK